MRRAPLALVAVTTLLASVLAGCTGASDNPSQAEESAQAVQSARAATAAEHLAQAMAVVPASTTYVAFDDRAARAQRLGLQGVTGESSQDEVTAYRAALRDQAFDRIGDSVTAMTRSNAAFSDLDVDWSVATPAATYLRMRDDLDLSTVAKGLAAAGMQSMKVDGLTVYVVDLDTADLAAQVGGYPAFLNSYTLVPARQAIVIGRAPRAMLDVATGNAPSAQAGGEWDTVLGTSNGVLEHAELRFGEAVCTAGATVAAAAGGVPVPADLGTPTRAAMLIESATTQPGTTGPSTRSADPVAESVEAGRSAVSMVTRARLEFADPDTAVADEPVRTSYLRAVADSAGLSRGGFPRYDEATGMSLSVDGAVESVDLRFANGPAAAVMSFNDENAGADYLACGS